jgi:acetylornithine/succinyldiaminopimelate/putrescine aminotransferase
MKRASGEPRFQFITGRNRVGWTDAMQRINWMLGAHDARILDNQYGEAGAQAAYYRIPLGPPCCGVAFPKAEAGYDLAGTLSAPFAEPPGSLREAEQGGLILGPAVTKITICNYITPATVRAVEWACALVPDLPHVYLTSGRDETVDKAIRTLRFHRGEDAGVPIGLEGGYVGHTTAAARSLSDPGVHRQGAPVHDWPRIPHPARVGVAASLAALRATIEAAGGPSKVIGLFVEPLQERTGWVIPAAFWVGLESLKAELDLPVVFVETAGAYYRTGLGAFAGAVAPLVPDVMIWWPGGQQGFVHVNRRYFISGPLAMVSTWDGDELSLVRVEHQLKAARKLDLGAAFGAMEAAAEVARGKGLGVEGLGLYRVLEAGERADALAEALAARGLKVRRLPQGRLTVAPGLDVAEAAARALEAALREA